jgi:hypothetical protein
VGLEFLKANNGWTDEELYDNFSYDIQVRYALGYRQLGEGDFDMRTLYYFRERLSRHMQAKGENLIQKAFEQVTDKQVEAFRVKTGKQRMDSFQIASNIRQMGRVQLLVEVLQRVQRMLNEADQQRYAEDFAPYVKGHAGHYVYRMKGEEVGPHLQRIGEFMQRLLAELQPGYGDEAVFQVLVRVFSEHFRCEQAQVAVKANQELSAASLQSPDDLEATYREKRGKGYQGYVTNVTETCDPQNELQLIIQVQVAANNMDDDQFLAEALPNLKERTDLETMYTDGGYGGPQSDQVLVEQSLLGQPIEHIQTTIRGRTPNPDKLHLANFVIEFHVDGKPIKITCPGAQTVPVVTSSQQKSFVARFEMGGCAACPLADKCPAQAGKRDPRRALRFKQAEAHAAERRRQSQERKKESSNLRAAVEATVRCVKLSYPDAQLPVRGKFRVTCMMIGSSAMTNVRRIQRYLKAKMEAKKSAEDVHSGHKSAPQAAADSFFGPVRALRMFFSRPWLAFKALWGC